MNGIDGVEGCLIADSKITIEYHAHRFLYYAFISAMTGSPTPVTTTAASTPIPTTAGMYIRVAPFTFQFFCFVIDPFKLLVQPTVTTGTTSVYQTSTNAVTRKSNMTTTVGTTTTGCKFCCVVVFTRYILFSKRSSFGPTFLGPPVMNGQSCSKFKMGAFPARPLIREVTSYQRLTMYSQLPDLAPAQQG